MHGPQLLVDLSLSFCALVTYFVAPFHLIQVSLPHSLNPNLAGNHLHTDLKHISLWYFSREGLCKVAHVVRQLDENDALAISQLTCGIQKCEA